MNKLLRGLLSWLLLISPAWANFDVTTGSGTHIFAIDGSNQGTSLCAATSTECPSSVLIDTTGAPLGTTGNHLFATVTNAGTFAVQAAQSTASALNATVVGTGTFAAQLTGTTNNINNISGTITLPTGAATQTTLASILTAIGTPAQASGSTIGISSFPGTAGLATIGGSAPAGTAPVVIVGNTNANVTNAGTIAAATGSASPVSNFNYVLNGSTWYQMAGDASGRAIMAGAGTAGTATGGVLTIQGVASMTPLLANPGTAANWGLGATGAAPPANGLYALANESGATGGHAAGLINCDNHVFKHITTATDTLAVQGVASQAVYICGWRSRAAGVATWYLENTASANANCTSTLTPITGVATEAANTGETILSNFWSGLKNTVANGLCINSTGTGGVDVDIWYAQF